MTTSPQIWKRRALTGAAFFVGDDGERRIVLAPKPLIHSQFIDTSSGTLTALHQPWRSRPRWYKRWKPALAKITINDVAERAGVSMKTVSRVLNGEPHVRDEIRERVNAAVRALNYRPNASARALAGSRSYLLGLLLNNPSRNYISQIEYGAMRACRQFGYHLVVEEIDNAGPELAERVAQFITSVRMDGVILTPPLTEDKAVVKALADAGVPVVGIAAAEDGAMARVVIDDRAAAREMTAHLLGQGHRNIAFIEGPASHAAAARRREGFIDAMTEVGIVPNEAWIRRGDFTFRSGFELAEQLLVSASRPTAIFAANDDMALGVMATAHRLRLDVPNHLSVVGFDNSPSAEVVWPQLTTVRQPTEDMASAAAGMLIEMHRQKGQPPQAQQLDFELIVRGSSGPVET